MTAEVLEMLQHILFWPGDTLIDWLLTAHPQIAAWLGLGSSSTGGLFAAVVSLIAGWGLFSGLCHLLLLVVQRWEARQAQRNADPLAATKEGDA
jgi:hypothetical protein